MRTAFLGIGCLVYVLCGCSLLAGDAVTVEILIYSGRENPRWVVAESNDVKSLVGQLQSSLESTNQPAGWSRLGFQGFVLHGLNGEGLAGDVRVFQGVIGTHEGTNAKFLKDKTGVEQKLVIMAGKQKLNETVRDAIEKHAKARNMQIAD